MKELVLETRNVSKKYGDIFAVKDMNMHINKGDVYGFIGKNGSGKTTTLRLITSNILRTHGDILLFGKDINKCSLSYKSRVGAVIENPAFYPNLSAYDNLEFYRRQKGIVDKGIIDEVLNSVKLQDTHKKKYKNFSLGMKQRLGIALAIMNNPDFLILDEPLNGLDPFGISEFRELIQRLNTELNITILISSHILSELFEVATKFGFIESGVLIKEIEKSDLKEECNKCISVIVDDVERASVVFEEILKTKKYKILPNKEIKLYDYLDDPSEVSFKLNTNGVRVKAIKEIGTTLQDYFINLVSNENLGGK